MFLLAAASNRVCEYSESRVVSAKSVTRVCSGPHACSALSSAVQDCSGLRVGSLMYWELVVDVAPYSSATVGMRTARPTEALSTVSPVVCQDRAALGDK